MKKTTKKPRKKRESYKFDTYFDAYEYKENVISDRGLDMMGKALVRWALEDEDALKLRFFFSQKGIGSGDIKRWRRRNKRFNAAYELAKTIIGDKREIGALKRKLDTALVLRTMRLYDDEYNKWLKKLEEWFSNLKHKEKEKIQPTTFMVNMQSFLEGEEGASRCKEGD